MAQKELEAAINKAISSLALEVYTKAQSNVPVVTGQLKASGNYTPYQDGFGVMYTAPYAEDVEFGVNGRKATAALDTGLSGHHAMIPRHTRRTKKGKVSVKAHVKRFIGSKPVRLKDGTWKTFNLGAETLVFKGRHFLGNALEEVFGERLSKTNGLSGQIQAKIIVKD